MMAHMASRTRPTLIDVARLSGVSATTVSRTLSRPDMVNRETMKRVMRAAQTLGYVPAGAARALASGRTQTVGAVVPTLDSPIFARALQSVQAALSGAGYQLLVASSDYNADAEAAVLRVLLGRGVDGLILVGAQRSEAAWQLLEGADVPVVLTWCGDARFDAVTVDNERAGFLVAEHLIGLGHRDFGVIVGKLSVNDRQRSRLAGVRKALAAAGLSLPDWRIIEEPLTVAGGRSGCAALLAAASPPSALICGLDILAVGCLSEAHARRLDVPRSLSIVGIDNLEMAAHVSPSLTTVHIPTAEIGAEAAAIILDRIRGEAGPQTKALPVELVIRQSTGPRRA
jgi:LacI family transcriptional regulator